MGGSYWNGSIRFDDGSHAIKREAGGVWEVFAGQKDCEAEKFCEERNAPQSRLSKIEGRVLVLEGMLVAETTARAASDMNLEHRLRQSISEIVNPNVA